MSIGFTVCFLVGHFQFLLLGRQEAFSAVFREGDGLMGRLAVDLLVTGGNGVIELRIKGSVQGSLKSVCKFLEMLLARGGMALSEHSQ